MEQAIKQAIRAAQIGEVPVGAVLVKDHQIIAQGHNMRETLNDPTAHAEIMVIREAAQLMGTWRLLDTTLFVTMEPCPMCAGAILQARIGKLVFGAYDPKAGCAGTIYNILNDKRFNHRVEVFGGICEEKCKALMKQFFQKRRV